MVMMKKWKMKKDKEVKVDQKMMILRVKQKQEKKNYMEMQKILYVTSTL